MKREFTVVESRPKVKIRLTRDSVAAADDVFDHMREIETYSFVDPSVLLSEIYLTYLPTVMGSGHSWRCIFNGKLIATVTVNGLQPHVREVEYAETNHLHFTYDSASY